MRNNLVTVFHCFDCGKALTIAEYSTVAKPDTNCLNMEPRLDTGAAISINRVIIMPCEYCKQSYIKPVTDIATALKSIENLSNHSS